MEKPITKKALAQQKRDLAQLAITNVLHVLHESNLADLNLWPRYGFKTGYGFGHPTNDTIWICCNAYGHEGNPKVGRIVIAKMDEFSKPKGKKQLRQIKLILDESIFEGMHFEDEFREYPNMKENIWLKFTTNTQ